MEMRLMELKSGGQVVMGESASSAFFFFTYPSPVERMGSRRFLI